MMIRHWLIQITTDASSAMAEREDALEHFFGAVTTRMAMEIPS